jgi:hypothetical protein
MGRHSKDKKGSRFRRILTGITLGVSTVAATGGVAVLLQENHNVSHETVQEATPWVNPECSSSASTDAELPDAINVFGQDAVKREPFLDPINSDWTIMLLRQSQDMRNHPDKREAFFDFMKKFDDLKKQFCAAGGKSPESIDTIVAQVNQRVSEKIEHHQTDNKDFTSPIETIKNKRGNSQDIAALNEAALQYIGLSDNRMLVARTNLQGDASKGADFDVLLVNDAPEGTPPHFVAARSHVNQLCSTDRHPGQLAFIDARNQRGSFFTLAGPKAGPG